MRSRSWWTAALAASIVLLAGCAAPLPPSADAGGARDEPTASDAPAASEQPTTSAAPEASEDESAPTSPAPTGIPGQASQNALSGLIYVQANSNTWQITVTESGEADIAEVVMYDTEDPAELPSGRQTLLWVCFDAVQTSGFPGSWVGDDFRFEIVADDGTRYDHLTAIDYAMADDDQDLYFAQGNDLDVPYEGVCALFLVPRGIDASTVAIVPDDGVPLELEL